MSITVTNISKSFGPQKALDDISFSIKKGEVVGFLGPNGAGKSTLMRILTTYYKADGGQAQVHGFDVERSPREVQRSIGYLPEHNPLYLDMYVREYLEFNAEAYRVPKAGSNRSSGPPAWIPRPTKRSGSSPRAIGSGWAWPPPCSTIPRY